MEPYKKLDLDKMLGIVKLPSGWIMDETGRCVTTNEDVKAFFNETDWKKVILAQATIDARHRREVFFVTAGYNQDWESAREVVVQKIKSEAQMTQEFSGDVPSGDFFVQK